MASNGIDDPDKELSDASSGFEGEDDDDDGDFPDPGYQPLAQWSDEESEEDEGESAEAAAAAAVPPLENETADKIKSLMSGFTLPDSSIPEWAKTVPEDVWKGKLVGSLHEPPTRRKKKNRRQGGGAAMTSGANDTPAAIHDDDDDDDDDIAASAVAPSDVPERRRRISFSQDDDELMSRVRAEVGLAPDGAGPVNGDSNGLDSHATTDASVVAVPSTGESNDS